MTIRIEGKQCLLIAAAAALPSLYWIIVQPRFSGMMIDRISFLRHLPGDIATYAIRFASISLLLGIIPFIILRLMGYRARHLGLRIPSIAVWRMPIVWIGVLFAAVSGYIGSFNGAMIAWYPYSKTLARLALSDGFAYLLLHLLLYIFCYYVPWEFFFRGVLIFPFLDNGNNGAYLYLIMFQTIPSVMLHFGHPLPELFGAIPFGIFIGWLAYKTGSIWPCVVVHATAGIALDISIVLRSYG